MKKISKKNEFVVRGYITNINTVAKSDQMIELNVSIYESSQRVFSFIIQGEIAIRMYNKIFALANNNEEVKCTFRHVKNRAVFKSIELLQ